MNDATETEGGAEPGRAVVRERLINRLRDAGLRRPRGMSEQQLVQQSDRLCDYLAYMAADNLDTLAETALIHATSPGAGAAALVWPSEALIRQWALALQGKPFSQHPIVASWLRSREGPVALAGGYLVELLRWLRTHRRALTPYDLNEVRRAADDWQGRLIRIRLRLDAGTPWPDDAETLAAWLRDEAEALQYVDEGALRRQTQPQEDAA